MLTLRIDHHHIDLLRTEAQHSYPIEACALIFGKSINKEAVVKEIVKAQNHLASAIRFEMKPETVAKAFDEAEKQGLDFIGIFHSHPAAASPSIMDLKSMKLWEDALWLILSSTDDNFAAYQLKRGKLKEIALRIE